jgi:hypothetical protein
MFFALVSIFSFVSTNNNNYQSTKVCHFVTVMRACYYFIPDKERSIFRRGFFPSHAMHFVSLHVTDNDLKCNPKINVVKLQLPSQIIGMSTACQPTWSFYVDSLITSLIISILTELCHRLSLSFFYFYVLSHEIIRLI